MHVRNKLIKQIFLSIFTVICGILFLVEASPVIEGIKNGLSICVNIIIPSLFCFFILTNFITFSGLNKIISLPLSPITKHLFHLDSSLGCVILMSMVGGYPIGAKAISSLLEQKKITLKTASRMMTFCCNSGPSFVITAVGVGLFSNINVGVALYVIQLLSAILIGIIVSLGKQSDIPSSPSQNDNLNLGTAFVYSVNSSVTTMAQMCGYILFFNAALFLLKACPIPQIILSVLSGFLEVTTGCITASSFHGIWSFVAVSFFIAFGGISVIFQVGNLLQNSGISIAFLFRWQLIRGFVAAGLSYCYIRLNPQILPVAFIRPAPELTANQNTPILTLCLLIMCIILIFTSGKRSSSSKPLKRTVFTEN